MASVNLGASLNTRTLDHITNDYHVNQSCVVNNGQTISNTVGVGQNPLQFDGAFSIYATATSGIFNLTASDSNRFRMQPAGANTTWIGAWGSSIGPNTGTGSWTLQYLDIWCTFLVSQGNNSSSFQDISITYSGINYQFYFGNTGGALTCNNLCASLSAYAAPAFTFIGAAAKTVTNIKAFHSGYAAILSTTGGVLTITNVLAYGCYGGAGALAGTLASTSTITRVFAPLCNWGATTAMYASYITMASPSTYSLDEWYVEVGSAGVDQVGTALPTLTNSVFYTSVSYIGYMSAYQFASSGNDYVGWGAVTYPPVSTCTSDNDFIACCKAFIGPKNLELNTTVSASRDREDWANFAFNYDGDSSAEQAPALSDAEWTGTNGWSESGATLDKISDPAIGTETPTNAGATPVTGRVYRVSITASAISGAGVITWTYGGVAGTPVIVGTVTSVITAANTNKLIISGAIGSTCTITAVSIKRVTSTANPKGWTTLTNCRTNPRTTPNKPTTWSGVADAVAGGNVTIDGTSGIKAKSRIELSLTSGGAVVLETPWQYGGFLDPWKANDFTLPVTTHQVVIPETNLPGGTTFYYKWHGVDPVGRDFWSAEGSFTTTAAPAGGAWVF
jgi:hypothetical protein